jgi:hypothetical protein
MDQAHVAAPSLRFQGRVLSLRRDRPVHKAPNRPPSKSPAAWRVSVQSWVGHIPGRPAPSAIHRDFATQAEAEAFKTEQRARHPHKDVLIAVVPPGHPSTKRTR